jgi:hypothetical protein
LHRKHDGCHEKFFLPSHWNIIFFYHSNAWSLYIQFLMWKVMRCQNKVSLPFLGLICVMFEHTWCLAQSSHLCVRMKSCSSVSDVVNNKAFEPEAKHHAPLWLLLVIQKGKQIVSSLDIVLSCGSTLAVKGSNRQWSSSTQIRNPCGRASHTSNHLVGCYRQTSLLFCFQMFMCSNRKHA